MSVNLHRASVIDVDKHSLLVWPDVLTPGNLMEIGLFTLSAHLAVSANYR